jgi:RimJ/RimL family protein N-acetyltransferase
MAGPENMEFTKKLGFVIEEKPGLFRSLRAEDVTEAYVQALRKQRSYLCNNPEDITIHWQQDYIEKIRSSPHNAICGLFLGSELIGTAGMQNIKRGETTTFGIFIIDTESRGKGYGKTLVWSSCYLLSKVYLIESFGAGMEKANIPSLKSFFACGFKIVEEDAKFFKVGLNAQELHTPPFIKDVVLE